MLLEWFGIFYREIKDFFDIYVFLMVLFIGLFLLFLDYKSLKDKKLKKEAKICRALGAMYIIGGLGLSLVFWIF